MARYRKDIPNPDVLITDLYIGVEIVGKIIMTDNEDAVMVFDENTVGRSVKKLLEPPSLLSLRATGDIRVYDRNEFATPVQQLPSEVDLNEYGPYFNMDQPGVVVSDNGHSVTIIPADQDRLF